MREFNLQFRPLQGDDNRSGFCCGNIELDRFFQRYAGQNQFRYHIGTSYVLNADDGIAGFVTVSAGEITAEMLSKAVKHHLPDYPLPVLRIARLAVDKHYQGVGLGKKLLSYSFQLALEMKARYGCVGVVVDAKAESVVFYQKLGFISLLVLSGELGDRPAPQLMFIALRTIEKAVASVALKNAK